MVRIIKIKILSRETAVKLSYCDFDGNKIIVSISAPDNNKPKFNTKNRSTNDILYLFFYDISKETKTIFKGYESMSTVDAILIRNFILK